MIKRFLLLIVLLAGTALTVLLGEGFDFLGGNLTPTATSLMTLTSISTLPAEATATAVFTVTEAPTATSEFTSTPVPTATLEPTATPTDVPTETPIPTNTPIPTATVSPFTDLFLIQPGSPVYTTNFVHPADACNWQGVAGQVLAKDGSPLTNYILKITGTYNGVAVNQIGLSGLVANEPYGPGSFEFVLGATAVDSANMLTIQLFSPQAVEVMGPVSISTFASCSQNLQIINFQQK